MNMKLLKASAGAAAAIAMTVALMQTPALAANGHAGKFEGVWDSTVTITNCESGVALASFRGFSIFIRGGATVASNNMPPASGSPAFGAWHHRHGRHYVDKFQLFIFGPGGVFVGPRQVTRHITLNRDNNRFVASIRVEDFDTDGNLVHTGCGTEDAWKVIGR
ncbi:MAG TPA: hypothetical protein VFH85_08455 [Gammaproteobacteria bacterium]|nr:hypothetical protein [Gammaproteobacteria bacterium]